MTLETRRAYPTPDANSRGRLSHVGLSQRFNVEFFIDIRGVTAAYDSRDYREGQKSFWGEKKAEG
jgi:hypothetical protein